MFGQLLPNKNKITIMWRDTYYANFASKVWNLNKAITTYRNSVHDHLKIFLGFILRVYYALLCSAVL
jgi:hypothetical protein